MLVAAGLALLLALLVARYVPRIARQRKQRRLRHLASEEYALRQLERATSRGDAGAVYAALTTWLERLQPGLGLRQFADTYGSAELQQQADALARSLFGDEKLVTDLRGLYTHVLAAKKAFQVLHDREVRRMLPPLNPA
jgi:hypothetical protein